jgi:hypothetical protein
MTEARDELDFSAALAQLRQFSGADLGTTIGIIEAAARGVRRDNCVEFLDKVGATTTVLSAAALMKTIAGQINVTIHALGILLCLPRLLEDGEVVEYVSLGAGNTGRAFDLETNLRVAEFKFIRWQGGAEVIRQNALFKDFFLLAESGSQKRKYLYVVDDIHPRKFFDGGRAIKSVWSRNVKLNGRFAELYGDRLTVVRDYYALRRADVTIQDVSPWLPELLAAALQDDVTED